MPNTGEHKHKQANNDKHPSTRQCLLFAVCCLIFIHTPNCYNLEPCHVYCCEGHSVEYCRLFKSLVPANEKNIGSHYPDIVKQGLSYLNIARERDTTRRLLSLQLQRAPLSAVSATHVTQLARELGIEMRRRKLAPKFISEREMKKHSEKIYKSLPEVVQKKEDLRKENIKKTNLLMASMFKKSLQKKTLRGSVNLSNYSTVIKI